MNPACLIPIEDVRDPRLAPYQDLRHREPSDGFIAEGPLVVDRLLQSDHAVQSVLVHAGMHERYLSMVPAGVPVYVIPRPLGAEVAGYDFHRGVLAHGRRREPADIESFLTRSPAVALGLFGITDSENVGSLLRSAAAMGVNDIVIGPHTVSPYLRRVIRVSMASVFRHRFYESNDPVKQIEWLTQSGVLCVATTLRPHATPINALRDEIGDRRILLLVGNEANGLDHEVQDACPIRATLPMSPGVDSLNVAIAGAIFLHELVR